MTVRPQQGCPGLSKTLKVNLMTNTIPRSRHIHPIPACNALHVGVIIGVFESYLQCVVIYIAYGYFVLNPWHSHRFEL